MFQLSLFNLTWIYHNAVRRLKLCKENSYKGESPLDYGIIMAYNLPACSNFTLNSQMIK